MQYVVSLSGGIASAVAADRAITRYGRDAVTLWFADTRWEDEDLYRFMADCMARWGGDLITYRDGRTPLDVAEQRSVIPDSRIAPCTFVLKVQPFTTFLAGLPKPVTALLGLDWREQHRMAGPRRNYGAIDGVTVDYPLMWKPLEYRPYTEVVREWGIAIPRLYALGFPHNNCGGRCVKQGVGEWQRLRLVFPERFAEVRDWEQAQQAIYAARGRKYHTINRQEVDGVRMPLSLVEIEQREMPDEVAETQDDMFGCFCSY